MKLREFRETHNEVTSICLFNNNKEEVGSRPATLQDLWANGEKEIEKVDMVPYKTVNGNTCLRANIILCGNPQPALVLAQSFC